MKHLLLTLAGFLTYDPSQMGGLLVALVGVLGSPARRCAIWPSSIAAGR